MFVLTWIFIGRTDAEIEAPVLWPPDVNSQLIRKESDPGTDWRHGEKGTAKVVGWRHQVNGPEFEQAPGDGEGQGNLVCCSLWVHKELDTTEQLNNNNKRFFDIGHFLKVFIELVTILLLSYALAFWPRGIWDLSSPTSDQSSTPCIRKWSLNHWTIREVPGFVLFTNISPQKR